MSAAFSEYVKVQLEQQKVSISLLREFYGWPYHRARAAKIGTLHPAHLSFRDAVDLADIMHVSVNDLAEAARFK